MEVAHDAAAAVTVVDQRPNGIEAEGAATQDDIDCKTAGQQAHHEEDTNEVKQEAPASDSDALKEAAPHSPSELPVEPLVRPPTPSTADPELISAASSSASLSSLDTSVAVGVPTHSTHASSSCLSYSSALASPFGSAANSPGAQLRKHTIPGSEADDTTDEDVNAAEATDDLTDAMTKTQLCTTLFSFTRANRVPINFVNSLSKAMCNSTTTLREFEHLRRDVDAIERDAAHAETLIKPPRKSFFGLGRAPKPAPSPVALAKIRTEQMIWDWVRGKMEALMLQQTRDANGKGHSHSTPNLQHLTSTSSPVVRGPPSIFTKPTSVSDPGSGPHTRHSSVTSMPTILVPNSGGSPSLSSQSPLMHSASFAPYVPGHTPLTHSPSMSGASTPKEGRYSPRRLWRTLFYNSALSASAATTPIVAVASSPVAAVVQAPHTQHFDSFPIFADVLLGLVRAPLPHAARDWLSGRLGASSDGAPLILHRSFPFTLPTPLNSMPLLEEEVEREQDLLSSWTDVLFNYRKHVPRPAGSPPLALLSWWCDTWQRDEPLEADCLPPPTASPGPSFDTPSPLMPPFSLAASSADPISPAAHLPTTSDSAALTAAPSPSSSDSADLSSCHIRLLLLLNHWIFLCPFDFHQDATCMERAKDFLRDLLDVPTPAESTAAGNTPATALGTPLLSLIQSMYLALSRPASSTSPLTPISVATSPLRILAYPFTEEVESIYSSNLFGYPPVQLAHELMLHTYDLFRRIPVEEWMDGQWQTKGKGKQAESAPYSNAYSIATAAANGGDDEASVASSPSAPAMTHTALFIGDFNRLVFWIITEILHPRLGGRQRLDLVLYFLELGMVSLKVHRNFHVAFAVAAAFSAQPLYRLKEIQGLATSEVKYDNVNRPVQMIVEGQMTPSSSPPLNGIGVPPTDARHHRVRVKSQYEELRAVTSSRNNYACYRGLIASLLDEGEAADEVRRSTHSTNASSAASTSCSTPRLWPHSASASTTASSTLGPRGTSGGDLGSPVQAIEFPSAQCEFDSTMTFSAEAASMVMPTSPKAVDDGLPPLDLAPPMILIPHLAVHLKDLTYSQELSGVEVQWVEDQATTFSEAQADRLQSRSSSNLAPSSSFASPSSTPPLSSPLSCRFDRSRWHRTSRLVCNLLLLQRLPVFSSLLGAHVPPLYTLLQVHLLTHVLPESELLKLSLDICPRVDRTKVQQQKQQKQTLLALTEEGFID